MLIGDNSYHGSPYGANNPKMMELDEVENYTLEDYGLVPDNIRNNHFGIDVTNPQTGQELSDAFYESKIEMAVAHVEKKLDIVILPRVERYYIDFHRNDFNSKMYIHAQKKPIIQVEKIEMQYAGQSVMRYPARWLKVYHLPGHVQMLPHLLLADGGQGLNLHQMHSGYPMVAGMSHISDHTYAPQLFYMEYVAGMVPPSRRGVSKDHEMHPDLWQMIIKIALKEVLQQWGRLIIGPGVASRSNIIDGVSQSIDTTQSAMHGGASAEIIQLDRDISELYHGLKSYYGFNLGII
jgi:hypothetical protein